MKRSLAAVIIKAGLIAGSLDILIAFADASWNSGIAPESVLRFIASGLIGNDAFHGPPLIALLGLSLHFIIALFWTTIFFFSYSTVVTLVRQKVFQAALYGILIWLVMNLIVLPLSKAPDINFHWSAAIKGIAILMVAIGLPVAHFARKYYQD